MTAPADLDAIELGMCRSPLTVATEHEIKRALAELRTAREQIAAIRKCTCDDFCDSPCPVHQRENELQNEVLQQREQIATLTRELNSLRETARAYREAVREADAVGETMGRSAVTEQLVARTHAAFDAVLARKSG